MKIKFFALLLLVLCSIPSFLLAQRGKETRKVESFGELKVLGDIDVELQKSNTEEIIIRAKGIDLEDVVTEVSGDRLRIKQRKKYFSDIDIKVIVKYKSLREIIASGGAYIETDKIEGVKHILLVANSGGKIETDVSVESIDMKAHQGGGIKITGNARSQKANVNTGGYISGFGLDSKKAYVRVKAGGYIKVTVKNKIDAGVSMGGEIFYRGNPKKVSQSTSLGGKITKE